MENKQQGYMDINDEISKKDETRETYGTKISLLLRPKSVDLMYIPCI